MTAVLDLIDEALHDWTVSVDAMRWTPPEPNWGQPPIPLRAEGFRYLTDVQGMDGYAAAAYGAMQLRLLGRSVGESFRKISEAFAEFARQIAPALKQVDEFLEQSQKSVPDRPAWQSKHGPPRRGRAR